MGFLNSILGKEKSNTVELDEVVAVIAIAPFIRKMDELTSAGHVQLLERYIKTVFSFIQDTGGHAVYLHGHEIAAFWPADQVSKSPASFGNSLCEIVREIRSLKMQAEAPCAPAIGLLRGKMLHASFEASGQTIPVSLGQGLNFAKQLSALAASSKRLILLDARLPVEWPKGVVTEDLDPVHAKGIPEPIPLKSVREIPA